MTQRPHLHRRVFVVSLLAALALCFLCAVCHSTQMEPLPAPAATGVSSCSEQGGALLADTASDQPSVEHHCEASEGQVPPTGQSALLLGTALPLIPVLFRPPDHGPVRHGARRQSSAPHGFTLLTRLGIQRV